MYDRLRQMILRIIEKSIIGGMPLKYKTGIENANSWKNNSEKLDLRRNKTWKPLHLTCYCRVWYIIIFYNLFKIFLSLFPANCFLQPEITTTTYCINCLIKIIPACLGKPAICFINCVLSPLIFNVWIRQFYLSAEIAFCFLSVF